MGVAVVALDLERTLVSDARTALPRPGLYDFLAFCHGRFARVAIFTTVEEVEARAVLDELAATGHVPPGLLDRLEYVSWTGEYKDLAFVRGAAIGEVVLVDDDGGWVRPDQRDAWISLAPWDGGPDAELARVRAELERRAGANP